MPCDFVSRLLYMDVAAAAARLTMSIQFIPPPKPPLPVAKKRPFQFVGRKTPKLYEVSPGVFVLNDAAQSAGSPVALRGKGMFVAASPKAPS